MEVRSGVVRRVSDGFAWVDVARQSGCGRCAESGGCGRSCSTAMATYVMSAGPDVREGAQVAVTVPQRAPLIAAVMSYGVALLALFVGVLTARLIAGESDAVIAIGALSGLCLSVLWLRHARTRPSIIPSLTVQSGRAQPVEP
ncbi:MAG TPA: SoxR reducing system RseC family protein [Methyloversatilis sp.]